MKRSDVYLSLAADCKHMAEGTEDMPRRNMLTNMEECWRVLAARALNSEELAGETNDLASAGSVKP